MPLDIYVAKRNGHRRKDIIWDEYSLDAILTAAIRESDPDMVYNKDEDGKPLTVGSLPEGKFISWSMTGIYYLNTKCPLWHTGEYVLTQDHKFWEDIPDADRPTLHLKAGEKIVMYRSFK